METFYPARHGTSVIVLVARDGVVMAADGLEWEQQPTDDPSHPYTLRKVNAEPKIAVCGGNLLCGMAGISPVRFTETEINVEYDFQDWIASAAINHKGTIEEFAAALQVKLRETFRDMDAAFKLDKYWQSQLAASSIFLTYEIVGFDGDTPQVCVLTVERNRETRKLEYPAPGCKTPTWARPGTVVYYPIPACEHKNIDEAFKTGTPQAIRYAELEPGALAAASALLPNAPPALHAVVAKAVTLIRVESQFNPERVGGIITVGVLIKGQRPATFQFRPN
jgi:hypothetical protein